MSAEKNGSDLRPLISYADKEEREAIKGGAEREQRSVSQFLKLAGLERAARLERADTKVHQLHPDPPPTAA